MYAGFKFRFYPDKQQEILLKKTLGCCRFVYNKALDARSSSWTKERAAMRPSQLMRSLTQWKRQPELEWLTEVSNVALQQSLNDLAEAYTGFFGKKSRYPRFKKKRSGGSFRLTRFGFRIKKGEVWIAKAKSPLSIRWSRSLPQQDPSQCTISLSPSGQWHISFLCKHDAKLLEKSTNSIGIDVGLTAFVTTNNGEKIFSPKSRRDLIERLPHFHKRLSRKKEGSRNREKSRKSLARLHGRISDSRKDFLHKLTTRLVRENQTIAIEDLAVRNMSRNRHLSKSILDASFSEMRRMLEYKCAWYGRNLIVVDRFFPSSKTCSTCRHVIEKLPLEVRSWRCPRCHSHHDRDINAAKNILAAGTAVNACGGGVRPIQENLEEAAFSEAGNFSLREESST